MSFFLKDERFPVCTPAGVQKTPAMGTEQNKWKTPNRREYKTPYHDKIGLLLLPAIGHDVDIGLIFLHGVELLNYVHAIVIIDRAHRIDDVLDIPASDVTAVRDLQALHAIARLIEELVCYLQIVVAVYKEVQVIVLFDDNGICFRDAAGHDYLVFIMTNNNCPMTT